MLNYEKYRKLMEINKVNLEFENCYFSACDYCYFSNIEIL